MCMFMKFCMFHSNKKLPSQMQNNLTDTECLFKQICLDISRHKWFWIWRSQLPRACPIFRQSEKFFEKNRKHSTTCVRQWPHWFGNWNFIRRNSCKKRRWNDSFGARGFQVSRILWVCLLSYRIQLHMTYCKCVCKIN